MDQKKKLRDRDIREPLFEYLEETWGKVRILEEKRMGGSRADIVVVLPDAIVGIEIKSDADTYARLESQVADYDLYFDHNYVVVGTRHALHIEEHVPEHWGILTVELEEVSISCTEQGAEEQGMEERSAAEAEYAPDFYLLRRAQPNPHLDWKKKLSMLWRPELAHIQELNALPAYKSLSKANLIDRILEKVPQEILQPQICEELFQRDYETIADAIDAYRMANGRKKRRRTKKRRRKYRPL